MKWIGSGIFIIFLGLISKFVLVGINSSQRLILAGAALIIFGYIRLIYSRVEYLQKPTSKKLIGWRLLLVIVFGFFTLLGLFLVIGFSVATLVRGETIHGEMTVGVIAGSIMCIPLAPAILSLKKAMHGNKVLKNN
jgi:hypothetical protein